MMQLGISSVSLLSFQWLLGRMGLLSFGHAVYVGLGSYSAIYLLKAAAHWPVFATIPLVFIPLLAAALVACLAALLAYPSTLKTGVVFAMLSLTVAELLHVLTPAWPKWWGGEAGLSANRVYGLKIFELDFASGFQLYYLILVYCLLAFFILHRVNQSSLGMAMKAVKSNPIRAQALGWNDHRVRQIVFVMAAFWAAIAGALQALLLEFVSTDVFSPHHSGQILLFALLGGVQNAWGAFLGALIWVFSNSYLSHISPAWLMYVGILLMLVVISGANGLVGIVSNAVQLGVQLPHIFKAKFWRLSPFKKLLFAIMIAAFVVGFIFLIETLYQWNEVVR